LTSYWTEQQEYVEQFGAMVTQVESVYQKQKKVKVVVVATVGVVVKLEAVNQKQENVKVVVVATVEVVVKEEAVVKWECYC
jgi:uncharacterized protein YfaP (DUF2135 family)